jgi:hypothetical protein
MEDNEKNAYLAEHVMGWVRREKYWTRPEDEDGYGGCYTVEARADWDIPQWAPDADIEQARLLVEALKPEERGRFITILRQNLFATHGGWAHWADEMFALLLAPPAAIRDAVLEVIEGR